MVSLTCSQIIETANKVVIVDVQLLRPYSKGVREYAERLGKPIDRIYVTHSHMDHWFGTETFADLPIYALAETKWEIEQFRDTMIGFKRSTLGELVPEEKVVPTHVVAEGSEVIDGVTFKFSKVTDTEAPVMLLIELPEKKMLIAQDLVYNDVYVCVGDKNAKGEFMFDGWISNLSPLAEKGYETILAGHGEPTDSRVFPKMIDYITYAMKTFAFVKSANEIIAAMMDKYPTYRNPEMFDFSNVFL